MHVQIVLVKQPLALSARADTRSKEEAVADAQAQQATDEAGRASKKVAGKVAVAERCAAGAYALWKNDPLSVEIPEVLVHPWLSSEIACAGRPQGLL